MQVSFYLFETSTEPQAHSACRLARKILKSTKKLWWYCPDPKQQHLLDELLWSFDSSSFITHGIDCQMGQICISTQLPQADEWIVFNFADTPIPKNDYITHSIEIIENNESTKVIGRDKFKYYRQCNITPRTFKL
ncbi:DNA polymerase III subunit chi [Acinetobacter sp. B5B]|uniref:DNA polymerase III subunit chi n=1 Tax=Acinetobacter baretiae TaxID=2605383 RepID=UPI0018C260DA|nr:DNA polymerase III subunit chi [Acinetobacter baretiae]MBF7681757.1 DNA polymerase III subunit chi [Acinetobacter baretiae]